MILKAVDNQIVDEAVAVLRAGGGSDCRHGRQSHDVGGVHGDHDEPFHPRA